MNTRVCIYCIKEYGIEEFEIANTIKGKEYRRHKCRNCYREMKNRRKVTIRTWLNQIKMELACSNCGFKDWRAIDYHHKEDKLFNIADAVNTGLGRSRIITEIKKCIPLCANCHRIIHHKERELG